MIINTMIQRKSRVPIQAPASIMERLFEAARRGNVAELHQLLQENSLILHNVALASVDNPLHIACLAGHMDFVTELLMLKPEFAKELSSEGYTPMHMASANGHVDLVRELMRRDHELCRLKGADGRTPFHLAALKGKVGVLKEMVSVCPDSIGDLGPQRETALHLAIRHGQSESLWFMLDWIKTMGKDDLLNIRDEQGNTVLHFATWKKQRQVLELLLERQSETSHLLEVNTINGSGLTPLDVLLIFPSEAGDREIQELLMRAGGLKAAQGVETTSLQTISCRSTVNSSSSGLLDYFKFHKGRDSPSNVRDALLVIAVLVATATYQVGINPPGGTWQEDTRPTGNDSVKVHMAGKSILGTYNSVAFTVFSVFNSIGFSLSLFVIGMLTSKFPLRIEFQICLAALYVTYNTALVTMAPESVRLFIIVITSVLPTLIPVAAAHWRKYIN